MALLITVISTSAKADYPPLDNQWSDFMDYGLYMDCPGTNPIQSCEVHVRYRVKRNVTNGVFQSGDIEVYDVDIAENCPCELSMYAAVIKALMETEDALFKPTRQLNEVFNLAINIKTVSPCIRKHYYIKGLTKYYRWVPCTETEDYINQYNATFQQSSNNTSSAWADLIGVNLIKSISFDACTSPCTSWCGNFLIDGVVIVGSTYTPMNSYTRYEGPLYVDPTPPPKISLPSELVDLSIQPNPAKDKIEIKFNTNEKGSLVIKIIDLLGNTQSEFTSIINPGIFNCTLDSKNITNGIYTLILILDGNLVASEKIIIER